MGRALVINFDESQAFSIRSNVLQGLTLLIFVYLPFLFGLTDKSVPSLSILVFHSLVVTVTQMSNVHGS